MLWQEGDTMYYKEGVTDPDYCVLKFTAVKGRYYSNFSFGGFCNLNLCYSISISYSLHIGMVSCPYNKYGGSFWGFLLNGRFTSPKKKRGKSILLFIILLVMATFVLTGLSIEKAAQIAQDNLRYALGGEFEIVPDYSGKQSVL